MSIDFSSDLQEEVRLDDGEQFGEGYAHYVAKAAATDAYVFGTPVVALCGYVWVPTRDPEKFPVCPKCEFLHRLLPTGDE